MKIDKKIEVQKVENGEVSGIISISSTENAVIEKLYIRVIFEATGKMPSHTKWLAKEVIGDDIHLQRNKAIKMPFCINFKYNTFSYEGENVMLRYGCQLCIQLSGSSFSQLDRKPGNTFSRLIKFKGDGITATDYFELTPPPNAVYQAKKKIINLTRYGCKREKVLRKKLASVIWILIATMVLFLFDWSLMSKVIFIIFFIPFWFVFLGLAFGIILGLEPYLWKSAMPEVMIKPQQGGFTLEFLNDEFADYEDLQIVYCIMEDVMDNRGSSPSCYHKEILYESEIIEVP